MNTEFIRDLIDRLNTIPDSEGDYYTCPEHGDMVNMSFVSHNPTDPTDRNFLRINVWCDKCSFHGHPFLSNRSYLPSKVKEFLITEFTRMLDE